MSAQAIIDELKSLGSESYRKTLQRHGIEGAVFGVKVEDMKKIVKRVKMDYKLALELYDTGIYDAMYLAGLIADDAKMTKKDLKRWLDGAHEGWTTEWTVPWVAAGSPHGWEMALEWIDSKKPQVAVAGWCTLRSLVSIKDDSELDIPELKKLLERVKKTIHQAPNLVRYAMNGYVIAVGSYVKDLTKFAMETAKSIGEVSVELNGACKVPYAPDYIKKVQDKGAVGKKRKSAKC